MRVIRGRTFAQVYSQILGEIKSFPEFECTPRGLKIREIMNLCVEIYDPTSNLFLNDVRSVNHTYLAGELYWYFSGRNDLEFIKTYSKFWANIVNPDGRTLNSAYGSLLFKEKNSSGLSPWQWAYQSLVKDKDTRQAIMHFNKPDYLRLDSKDIICTLIGTFSIRQDMLYFTIMMRSQDEIKGRTFDVPFFTLLQQQMRNLLLPTYPKLKLGSFFHINVSSHIYENDFDLVQRMVNGNFRPDGLPVLKENIIDCDGVFDENKFQNSSDELITWIRNNLKKEK